MTETASSETIISNIMSKSKTATFYVEGPDWTRAVQVDTDVHTTERDQLFEAATIGIETELKETSKLQLGPIILVKKKKTDTREAMVNAYICLNNAAQFGLAEKLRDDYKKSSGNDLAIDEQGISF